MPRADIRVTMAMVPDIHSLADYPLGFVHDIFAQTARDNGFAYVDLLPAFRGLTPEDIWAMPGLKGLGEEEKRRCNRVHELQG